ncbi:hypothetical protein [Legionella genomosp. 1]|uniref:hypothetical protein n=1 Tax=Legionella genomosp. 1 TaxID=1093625 RepID=UPI0013EFBF24|nr:hypothetical protein [Legionella genomosp. 1]
MGAFEIVAVIYLLGILINLRITLIVLKGFRQWKEETQFALFAKRPGFKGYLIRKIILWPLYFITEKSPLRRLSGSFFSHYGDPGHTYFGTLGLENFLNDLLKGKNLYKHCDIKHLFWPIDGESSICTDFTLM